MAQSQPKIKLLVLSDPAVRYLRVLDQIGSAAAMITSIDKPTIESAAPNAEVIFNARFNADHLRQIWPLAQNLRWVHSMAAGVENTLFPALLESSVLLTNSRGVFKRSLAEFVAAAVLFFAKDLRRMLRNQAEGRWEQFEVEEVHGQTVGIVGYGEIGRAAAGCANALGMRIAAIKRRPDPGREDHLVEHIYLPHQLHDLLRASDYVVVAAPHTSETVGMIGENEIRNMKPSAVVINVGRGPVIVESALVRALQERRIKGAALDVFDQEPLPTGHPFYQLENVLLSPHCADHTFNWLELAMQCFVDNFQRYRSGQRLENIVDKTAGY